MDHLFASIDPNFLQQVDASLLEKIRADLRVLHYLDTHSSSENGRPAKRRKLNQCHKWYKKILNMCIKTMTRNLRVFRWPVYYASQKCTKIHDIHLVKNVQYACKWNCLNSEKQVIPDIYGRSKKKERKEKRFNLYIPKFHIFGHNHYNDANSQLLKDAVSSRKKDMEYFLWLFLWHFLFF